MKHDQNSMNTLLRLAALVFAVAAAAPVLAQSNGRPPGQISYQGYLTDANGFPLATNTPKNYNVVFRIYNDPSSALPATTLWAEQQVVTVDRGYFTVMLGNGSAFGTTFFTNDLSSVFSGADASSRYLGLTVQGLASPDFEISPRLRLTTSPYALLAANATALTGPSAAANGLVVRNGLVVDGANLNSGPLLTNTALTFGSAGTEGIASQRSATPTGLQNDLALFTAGQPRLTVLNNGNIGIGTTTSPTYPVTLKTPVGTFGFVHTDGNVQVGSYINGAGGFLGTLSNHPLGLFVNNGGSSLTIAPGGTSGFVGIGQDSPGFPLNFASTFGDKISLYGNSGSHYGFGVQSSKLQIHTDTLAADIVFGYGSSAAFTETMRIKGNGKVGIGTTALYAGLTLNGTWSDSDGTAVSAIGAASTGCLLSLAESSVGTWNLGMMPNDGGLSFLRGDNGNKAARIMYLTHYPTPRLGIGTTAPANTLSVAGSADFSGRVGIGTTAPRAPLDVAVSLTGYAGSFMRLGYTGTPSLALTTGYVTTDNPSIIATGDILSGAMIIASDARLKKVGGRSDGGADLNKLMGIEVTDYTMVDAVTQGDRPYKKVIAQQVEGVYPQAVSRTTGVVPDIYAKAEANGGLIALTAPLKAALKLGDKVRLVNEQGSDLHEVTQVTSTGFRVKEPINGPVFVYGREVSDFRSVDYDAISMLNVSATQELARQLAAEKAEVETLRDENRSLAAKLDAMEARFARLEKAHSDSEQDKELASLERK